MTLLLTIAVASIAGTLIPQSQSIPYYVSRFGEPVYRIFATLNLVNMYGSVWFQALLALLLLNIVVCSVNRIPTTVKAAYPKGAPNPAKFRNRMNRSVFDSPQSLDALKEDCRRLVPRGSVQETAKGFFILGEKGRWTRFGVYAVHLSIVLLSAGALVGNLFGFGGYVNIPEGKSVSAVNVGNSGMVRKLPFTLRCDHFKVSFYPNGEPKEYLSSLTILEHGRPVVKKDIIVNRPLRYHGINIFQSSYGQIPANRARVSFTVIKTGKRYMKAVKVDQPVNLPEDLGTFELKGYEDNGDYMGRSLGPAFSATLTPKGGAPQTILLPLQFPSFDRMRNGAVAVSVSSYDKRYYTGLQVTKDPGVGIVYSGFIMLIIGCFITFFTSHQRLFVEVTEGGKIRRVTVTGSANKNKFGMQQEVKRIAARLGQRSDN